MKKTFARDLTVTERDQLERGLYLLAHGEPFAAHESFEAAFRSTRGPNQTLFRGLTQLAASYHQLCLGRGRAARSTLTKAFRNLEIVGALSEEFQKRVECLFDTLGAHLGCARFIPRSDDARLVWPAPAGLHVPCHVVEGSGGSMSNAVEAPKVAGFDVLIGLEMVTVSVEEVVAQLVVGPQHQQPWGIVHGGIYCALVETVCSVGGQLALAGSGGFVVGVDNHTSFLKATRTGVLRASARPLAKSKRTQLWEANITNQAGELVASGRVRLMVVEQGKILAGEVAAVKRGG